MYYERIFDEYKQFILTESKYAPRVVKIATQTSTYFPIITCMLMDNPDNAITQKRIYTSSNYYFTIEIYAKDKDNIASQVIVDELKALTIDFFSYKLGMRKTLDQPKPNIDTKIFRQVLNYQCNINNRGQITRI